MKQTDQTTGCLPNRWLIAAMGTLLMLMLGTVYAWSFFQNPIMSAMGWSNAKTAWAFSIAILCLGFAASWGGVNLQRIGPRKLAITGGAMFAAGYIIGGIAFKLESLVLLYLGFGLIGGIGNGLGYVTPVATVSRWFPDKKGFATGLVVMGFGFGALVMSKIIGPVLMQVTGGNLTMIFSYIGIIMAAAIFFGSFIKNPPEGYVPEGYTPPASEYVITKTALEATVMDCILSPQWLLMWFVFFVNITAGIMFIGFQSPMLQDILGRSRPGMDGQALAAAGATLIAASSMCNGLGRFFWGWLSDRLGRIQTFRIILATQIIVFIMLHYVNSPVVFSLLVCYVLLCYGGGFGTMPSFVLDVFGPRLMPVVYGAILTAWSLAGVAGPQIVAVIKDTYKDAAGQLTFTIAACLLVAGFFCSFFIKNSRFTGKADKTVCLS
jgi:MFS transporter, OFA family, oxalate/formate antiporter